MKNLSDFSAENNSPSITELRAARPTLAELEQAKPPKPSSHDEDFSAHEARVLACLREAGPRGCSNEELRKRGCGERPSNRFVPLRKKGYLIKTDRSVRPARFVLLREADGSQPRGVRPDARPSPALSGDWYQREHGPRPAAHPWKSPFSEKRIVQDDAFVLTPPPEDR